MAGEASRKNGKKGGRKPGTKNAATLQREAVLKSMRERVMGIADRLLDSQLTLALGQYFLYKIEKYYAGTGKNRKLMKKKPKLVTDPNEVRDYIEGLVDESLLHDDNPAATYYFITTKEPSNQALTSLRDFTFGKPVQSLAFTDPEGESLVDGEAKEKSDKAINEYLSRKKTKKQG